MSIDQDCGWPHGVNLLFLAASSSHCTGGQLCASVPVVLVLSVPTLLLEHWANPEDQGEAELPAGTCGVWFCLQVALDFLLQVVENEGHPQHEKGSTWGGLHHSIACLQHFPLQMSRF